MRPDSWSRDEPMAAPHPLPNADHPTPGHIELLLRLPLRSPRRPILSPHQPLSRRAL